MSLWPLALVLSLASSPGSSMPGTTQGRPVLQVSAAAVDDAAAFVLATRLVGHGCCSNASPPSLSAVLGPVPAGAPCCEVEFRGEGAPVGGRGWMLLGAGPSCMEDLGNGGFLYLDRTRLVGLGSLRVDAFGEWSARLSLPLAIADLGQGVVVQAMFPDPRMSIGFGLSDALELRVDGATADPVATKASPGRSSSSR